MGRFNDPLKLRDHKFGGVFLGMVRCAVLFSRKNRNSAIQNEEGGFTAFNIGLEFRRIETAEGLSANKLRMEIRKELR